MSASTLTALLESSGPLLVLLMVGAIVALMAILNDQRDQKEAMSQKLTLAVTELAQATSDAQAQKARYDALVTYYKTEVAALDAELATPDNVSPDAVRKRLAALLGGVPPPPA